MVLTLSKAPDEDRERVAARDRVEQKEAVRDARLRPPGGTSQTDVATLTFPEEIGHPRCAEAQDVRYGEAEATKVHG